MRPLPLLKLLILLIPAPVWAFTGQVIGVHDGDTLTVLVDKRQVKVRLAEIDAPELGQPFGARSRQALAGICYRVLADVAPVAQDRYGRTVGYVTCGGIEASAQQVRQGYAWVYDKYSRPDSPLYWLQNEARSARRGLWLGEAVPPWQWRKQRLNVR